MICGKSDRPFLIVHVNKLFSLEFPIKFLVASLFKKSMINNNNLDGHKEVKFPFFAVREKKKESSWGKIWKFKTLWITKGSNPDIFYTNYCVEKPSISQLDRKEKKWTPFNFFNETCRFISLWWNEKKNKKNLVRPNSKNLVFLALWWIKSSWKL